MLISATKSKHITDHFIEPYFLQTDSSGKIIAASERFRTLLSKHGISNYYTNLFSVFSQLGNGMLGFHDNTNEAGISEVFDLHINSSDAKPIVIRWVTSEVSDEQTKLGWQLTGMEIPATKITPYPNNVHDSAQLQKEKELSDTIIKSLPGIFYLFDNTGKYLRWNERLESISGYTANEIINMTPGDFFAEDEKPYIQSRIEKVFSEGSSDAEANLLIKNGKKIPYYFTGCAINFNGKPCLAGAGIDISELRRAEQLLALEKKVLAKTADPNTSLYTTIDCFLSGIEKIFPDMICSVLTLDDDGISIRPLSAPSIPVAYSELINGIPIGPAVGSCGTAMYLKKRIIVTDIATDPLWEEYKELALSFNLRACWSLPVLDAQGEILATFATYYNFPKSPTTEELAIIERTVDLIKIIIENKKAEEKIKISNERYMLATKATNDAIWDWDIKSGVCFWGEGFYTQFAYKPFPVINEKTFWENNIHPADRERVINSKEDFIHNKKEGLWAEEYRFRKADGKYAIVADRGFLVLDNEKNVMRAIGSMQDITEKKNLEKKLLQQELSRQKSIAQAMITAQEKERAEIGQELHDNVNQILSTSKLYVELAKTNNEERLSLLESCSQNINNAINEIRKISRALVPSSIEDLGLLESIKDLAEQIRITKSINVEFYTVNWADEHINNAQKLTIFRIIQEQANNVVKHSGANNLIIELEMDEYENTIKLNIADDGKGFDPEKIKAKKSMGFSNIFSRTDLFDGKMSIVSAPEKGCKLKVQIPIYNSQLNKLYE